MPESTKQIVALILIGIVISLFVFNWLKNNPKMKSSVPNFFIPWRWKWLQELRKQDQFNSWAVAIIVAPLTYIAIVNYILWLAFPYPITAFTWSREYFVLLGALVLGLIVKASGRESSTARGWSYFIYALAIFSASFSIWNSRLIYQERIRQYEQAAINQAEKEKKKLEEAKATTQPTSEEAQEKDSKIRLLEAKIVELKNQQSQSTPISSVVSAPAATAPTGPALPPPVVPTATVVRRSTDTNVAIAGSTGGVTENDFPKFIPPLNKYGQWDTEEKDPEIRKQQFRLTVPLSGNGISQVVSLCPRTPCPANTYLLRLYPQCKVRAYFYKSKEDTNPLVIDNYGPDYNVPDVGVFNYMAVQIVDANELKAIASATLEKDPKATSLLLVFGGWVKK